MENECKWVLSALFHLNIQNIAFSLFWFVSAVTLSVKTVLLFIVYLFIFNMQYLIKMLWTCNFPVLWWAFYSFSFVLARNLYGQFSFQIQNFYFQQYTCSEPLPYFICCMGNSASPDFDFVTEWSRSVLLKQPLAPEGSFRCHWVPKPGLAFICCSLADDSLCGGQQKVLETMYQELSLRSKGTIRQCI